MAYVDVVIGTTVATTTVGSDSGMISLPADCSNIGFEPTTMYLQGVNSISEVRAKKYTPNSIRINKKAVKYNVLKLRYAELGTIVKA